ncbi:MAG: glycosyltransferase family 39 protein, partial [Anaerolineaceae bacterium]|nr:glycosyltransferase family 39 protein [Anaerolineaceae bacterium]
MIEDQKSGSKLLRRMNIFQWAVLTLVILLGFGIRIYDLKEPPLDFHPVRQLRSALIARSVYYQINPDVSAEIKQQAYDLANLEVYEPPIFEYLVGGTYYLLGSEKLWISRIFLALFWSIGGIALFALCRRYASYYSALLGLAFYLFLPFGVIASRSFQPEPWMVMWILLTAFALYNWAEARTWKWALMVGLFGGMAVLVKVVAAVFVVGMVASVSIATLGLKNLYRSAKLWVMAILILAPTILFYLIFHQGRSSSFFSFWFGSLSWLVATTEFYADWLAMIKVLMGLAVFMLAILGFLLSSRKAKPLLLGGWVGYVIYGLIFPYQYVTHEYYHLPLVALVAVSVPPLLDGFINKFKEQHWVWRGLAIGVFLFASGYSLYVARSIMYASDYKYEPL